MQTWEEKIIEREKALEEGIVIGSESAIRNLIANLGFTPEKAMDVLGIPIEKRDEYLQRLG